MDGVEPWLIVARRRRAVRVLSVVAIALAVLLFVGLLRSVIAHPGQHYAGSARLPAQIVLASVAPEPEPVPQPSSEALVTPAREPDPRMEPASRPARKLLALKDEIQDTLTHTAYEHRTRIRPKDGVYIWDCSAMGAWMLRKVAPRARKAMNKGRPVARDFYRMIRRSPTRKARNGWRRLAHIEDVRPGDMFAWERPPGFPSRNTGHVGFAIGPARKVPGRPGAYTIRIVDATSLPHKDDTRLYDEDGGIGEGTIMFMTDGEGHGTGYGWCGPRCRVIETPIGFARLSR